MATINTLRGLLVAGTALAVIVALAYQLWVPAVVLTIAIAFHAGLWVYLRRHPVPAEPKVSDR